MRFVLGFVILFFIGCNDAYMPGYDFKLFQDTPAQEVAEAVEADDYDEVLEALSNAPAALDYRESKYGRSVIFLAVINGKEEATRALLDSGADISIRSSSDSSDVLMSLCKGNVENCDTRMLTLLPSKSPDMFSYRLVNEQDRASLLCTAISSQICLEFIQALIQGGADVNYTPDHRASDTPVSIAILNERLDVARFLLMEAHADVPEYCTMRPSKDDHIPITVSQMLTEQDYSQNAEKEKLKEEILGYLQSVGKK